MTSLTGLVATRRAAREGQPAGGVWFDAAMLFGLLWLVLGVYVDAWAHNHLGEDIDTFFTPWHAALYSGMLATAVSLGIGYARYVVNGYHWLRALPKGYELSALGVAIFGVGGFGDMLWHTYFGIEVNVDAAVSPTHIFLNIGLVLLAAGPLRAAWRRADPASMGLGAFIPAIVSLALAYSSLTVLTQIFHPLAGHLWYDNFYAPSSTVDLDARLALGIAGVVIQTVLMMGMLLFVLRRWASNLPFGAFTLALSINAGLLGLMRDRYWLAASIVSAGLTADLLVVWIRRSSSSLTSIRAFALVIPIVQYGVYYVILPLTGVATWWSPHAIFGAITAAGAGGLLLSLIAFPPEAPAQSAF